MATITKCQPGQPPVQEPPISVFGTALENIAAGQICELDLDTGVIRVRPGDNNEGDTMETAKQEARKHENDLVNSPAHYAAGKIEVAEALEDWDMNFRRGNAIKYIARAGKKLSAPEVQDLEKAIWYLKREIELIKAANEGREPCKPKDMVKDDARSPRKWEPEDYTFMGHWQRVHGILPLIAGDAKNELWAFVPDFITGAQAVKLANLGNCGVLGKMPR